MCQADLATLSVDTNGYRLHTLDHDVGALRLDLEHAWGGGPPTPLVPQHLLDEDVQVRWAHLLQSTHCQ